MNKNIVIVIAFIFVIGFMIGCSNPIDLTNIVSFNISFKYIVWDIFLYILAVGLSCIGIPFYFLLLLLEIIISGIVSSFLIVNFTFIGFGISLILLVFKFIIWFMLFLNGFYSIKLIKNNYKYFFKRYRVNKENSKKYFKKIIIINIILIVINLINIIFNKNIIVPLTNHFLF